MKTKLLDKYLNTKKKKNIAFGGTLAVLLTVGAVSVFALNNDAAPKLLLNKDSYTVEYGEPFKADLESLVNTKNLDREDKEYLAKNTKIESNIKNDVETVTKEDGSTEEKDRGFAKVGDYKVTIKYQNETKEVKVTVKDTTKPTLEVPENIEILQGTDLAAFDFKSLISATDLAQMNELNIDYSTVDVNTIAEYTAGASIEDVNKNKAEKEFKVTVIALPSLAEDEVVVEEKVTNEDGTTSVKTTVKKKSEAQANGNKVVSNNSSSSSSTSGNNSSNTSKPSTGGNSGSTGGSSSGSTSGSTSGGNTSGSGNSGSTSGGSGSSENTGGSSTPTEPSKPEKVWEYWAECRKCGKRVESTVSLQDAINKLKSSECTSFSKVHACHSGGQEVYK